MKIWARSDGGAPFFERPPMFAVALDVKRRVV